MARKISDEYFSWLIAPCDVYHKSNYKKLLKLLYSTKFRWSLPGDANRAEDGLDLRLFLMRQLGYDEDPVALSCLPEGCTVLEMMVALARRCEALMSNSETANDRTFYWFWIMVRNLGLSKYNDGAFEHETALAKLNTFMNRKYKKNGEGSLFSVPNIKEDFRNVEIWTQAAWFIDSNL